MTRFFSAVVEIMCSINTRTNRFFGRNGKSSSGIQTERGTNEQFIAAAVCVAIMLALVGDKLPTSSLGRLHENCVFSKLALQL